MKRILLCLMVALFATGCLFAKNNDRETRSHTDGFQRNNAKCLDEKGISRFVPHSSI